MSDIVNLLNELRSPLVLPDLPVPLLPTIPARWMYERLVKSIAAFEAKLDSSQEVGARLVSFGNQEIIHIEDIGYWGPDLLTFRGRGSDGNPVELLQHITQISVLLVAVPKSSERPRRIGFELARKLDSENVNR